MPRKRKEETTVEPGKGLNLDSALNTCVWAARLRVKANSIRCTRTTAMSLVSIHGRQSKPFGFVDCQRQWSVHIRSMPYCARQPSSASAAAGFA